MNFTRKGYGRIFVMNKVEIPVVDEIKIGRAHV